MSSLPESSETRRNPTDGEQGRDSATAGGATATTADDAAGPSAATPAFVATALIDYLSIPLNNDGTPEAAATSTTPPSASGDATAPAPAAKSSDDATPACASTSTGSSPSSSSEVWHSASSRLQRTPYSDAGSSSSASSVYATPGTTASTPSVAEAGNKTNTGGGNNSTEQLPSSTSTTKSSSAEMRFGAIRKQLKWTPPPSADTKVRLCRGCLKKYMYGTYICAGELPLHITFNFYIESSCMYLGTLPH
jgi:hypothetical protein